MRRIPKSHPRNQQGAVLVVVLVLLLVMTLLGLASLRGTVMEERMTANLRDRGLGFQSAEAALREAEALVLANGHAGFPAIGSGGCSGALCDTPDATQPERWLNAAGGYWTNAATSVGALAIAPQYFVEYMGEAPSWPKCDSEIPVHPLCLKPRYRVTARSTAADRATVILQSNFAGP
ncbi:pilus assembly protein [Lysobacter sp. TLK-CK17T]|uniref:Pilus assembly protein n=2 Tax=Marilutibacter chinensis TaxID=2912247 RepID=A0ABS9HVP6_9GAMM|nr:pilus assembly protein [Lysobacter chinensis]MCF7222348.1 pilus assembly protein [Lysobacter chinensis]